MAAGDCPYADGCVAGVVWNHSPWKMRRGMPTPVRWANPDRLIVALRRSRWEEWFLRERRMGPTGLVDVIRGSVGANTFRAFRKPPAPSAVFRTWAEQALVDEKYLDKLLRIRSEDAYREWLDGLVQDFRRRWKREMGSAIAFGPSYKLPNLLVKAVCASTLMPDRQFQRLVKLLHVPLDSYSIQAVRHCISVFPDAAVIGPVPASAGMSFVRNDTMYNAFQDGIRLLAREAGALDCLAWNEAH